MIFDLIIIGAGISGSYAASKIRRIREKCISSRKSRVAGGRCSTKPILNNIVDYGCQYINPKTKLVKKILKNFEKNGMVKLIEIVKGKQVYISPYGMNRIPQYFYSTSLYLQILKS